jgi:DNA-directed RNA polymerase specialized sigma subunit
MNVAEVKLILNSCWNLEMKLKSERMTLERLRVAASKSTPSYSLVSGGGGVGQKVENCVLDIVELEAKSKATIRRYIEAKAQTLDLIGLLPDEKLRRLLKQRYIHYAKWEAIAIELKISYRRVHQLHSKALNMIANYK